MIPGDFKEQLVWLGQKQERERELDEVREKTGAGSCGVLLDPEMALTLTLRRWGAVGAFRQRRDVVCIYVLRSPQAAELRTDQGPGQKQGDCCGASAKS